MVPLDWAADFAADDTDEVDGLDALLAHPPRRAPILPMPMFSVRVEDGSEIERLRARPSSPWQHFFNEPRVAAVTVPRPRLYRGALESDAQWVNFSATPGMGRSTLLQQIAEELDGAGEPFGVVWGSRQAGALYDGYKPLIESGKLFAILGARAEQHPSKRYTMLIDDYDLTVTPRYLGLLRTLFERLPGFRLITTTFNPLDRCPLDAEGLSLVFREPPSGQLCFSFEESRRCLELALAATGRPQPAEQSIREIFESTGGSPLGVAFGADLLTRASQQSGETLFLRTMQTIRRHIVGTYPNELLASGFSLLASVLSLMPRFKDDHISLLFPEMPRGAIRQLESMHVLGSTGETRYGERVWSEDYWSLACEWNALASDERRSLAMRLDQIGDAGGAFEQWLFVGDLARCDRALRSRFLTVFEDLTPEAEQKIFSLPANSLREYPMLRKLRVLLEPCASAEDLATIAGNLIWIARKGSPDQSLLALALRAAILVRLGDRAEAVAQAGQVLAECPPHSSWAMVDVDDERLTRSEAALTATLVLLECGTFPRGDSKLPDCTGCDHLDRRRSLTQMLLDAARSPRSPGPAKPIAKRTPLGYRSLVFSPAQCYDDIEAFETGNRYLHEALDAVRAGAASSARTEAADTQGALILAPVEDVPRSKRVPSGFQGAAECRRYLLEGNLPAAVKHLSHDEVPSPGASIARTMVHLAKGQPGEALKQLDELGGFWGERVAGIEAVLRACAMHRRGQDEPARLVLYQTDRLPEVAVAEGLSLIPADDGRALVALHESLAAAYAVSRSVGLFGTVEFSGEAPPMRALTKKERLVLDGLRRGLNTREIADESYLSVNTVRTHVRAIAKKLHASGQADILRRAWELKLIEA